LYLHEFLHQGAFTFVCHYMFELLAPLCNRCVFRTCVQLSCRLNFRACSLISLNNAVWLWLRYVSCLSPRPGPRLVYRSARCRVSRYNIGLQSRPLIRVAGACASQQLDLWATYLSCLCPYPALCLPICLMPLGHIG